METCFVVIFSLLLLCLGELIYKPIKFKSNILRYIDIAPCYLLCKEPNIFLVFLYDEYLVSLNFDTSLCMFWYSHLLLGYILCASLDQCNISGLRKRNKDFRLVNLICKIWQFYGNMWQIGLFVWQNLGFQMTDFRLLWCLYNC